MTTAGVLVHNDPMLTRYRRHRNNCPHRPKGRQYTRCTCPIWVDGTVNGNRVHHTLRTTDWQRAGRLLVMMEDPDAIQEKSVTEATADFLSHRRSLAPSSKRKYNKILRLLEDFCLTHNKPFVNQLDVTDLDKHLLGRQIAPLTSAKELQTLRTFCEFCVRRRWMRRNIARDVDMPTGIKPKEVKPYSASEMAQILKTCDQFGQQDYERRRARAMVLLMRYVGLRISDVMTLARDRIQNSIIHLHTQKTSAVVRLPLPVDLREALDDLPIPKGAEQGCPYFFWNGKTSRRQIAGMGHKTLAAVFRKAQIPSAHSHRFRHTLATEILAKGGTIQDVADILGISPHVAHKHYVKWSLAREERIFRLMEMVHGRVFDGRLTGQASGVVQ